MKYTSQHCSDKKLDGSMAFYRNAVVQIIQNHGEKSCFRSF